MSRKKTKLFSGTSGLVVPVARALYPPEFSGKSRLEYYASLFNSIEINSSFYKMPKVATVVKWADSVPADFRFTFKLPKAISHVKQLSYSEEDVETFFEIIDHVGDKRGCILVQFPPGLKADAFEQVQKLLVDIKQNDTDNEWKVAVEFRNTSWYDEEVYELLKEHNVSMVLHDLPASATPLTVNTADFMYLRFHGPGGRYKGSYADEFLQGYASHIKEWMVEGKMVYVYFNNTMGDAVKNLQTLNNLVG
jgi:uncharacterized protein YecE (DUF72 family)